jgi:type IV pilus assembly protein PilC
MATFAYTVRDSTGVTRTGTSEAESADILARRLREQGFNVSEVKQTKAAKKKGSGTFIQNFQKVKIHEQAIFFRQFSTMVDAGVSLVRCLNVLSEQTQNARLRRIIIEVQHEVEAGQTLSKSMSKFPSVFSNLTIGLVRAGEVGGVLEETLQRLSTFLEKDVKMKNKVKSALTYPAVTLVLAIGIVVLLCVKIVPTFVGLFKSMGAGQLPAITQGLMNFSAFLINDGWLAAIIVGVVWAAFKMFKKTKFGTNICDRIILKLPVVGSLIHKVALARFSATLGTLLVSGVPILQAMETVAGIVGNSLLADAIMEARARIREGDRIGDPLRKSGLFPPMVVHMISIGEESGALDAMLGKIADFYEDEVEQALAALTDAIQPVLIVLLGGLVLYILIAMWMPIVGLIQSLTGGGGDGSGSGSGSGGGSGDS